ncbi:MAG TPA: 2-isopropylmalate synthase [Macromonas sp.]|nr:2-isopropylmalate synthase [Macromonas sp.]
MKTPASPKYQAFAPVPMPQRQWPGRTIDAAPVWMSTDLRDGNQALFEPMDIERKLQMFQTLCGIGFKEIEVAFPSASQTEFDFVRTLIEQDRIPADVTIQVLTQAREHLVRRTMASLKGARRAIVHVYNATSKPFREFVFGMSRQEVIGMAVSAVQLIRELAAEQPETEWVLEYSPETFTATELDFALEICNAVTEAWGASPQRPVILNLPTTVEVTTPNVFADQIEWMHTRLARRDGVVLSVHPHNDRGTAVAAAELALMAGAQRVEGCLFGNGERTGNVDLVTLALNLHTQGIDCGLDFSDINAVARTYEYCTQLPIHPRHPYVGDLVFTAFSGSHQDAIKKGFSAQKADEPWAVPYLPIDPADVGRAYDSIIRINSQSGKGGVAYLLEAEHGIVMPRRMQVEFSGVVQRHSEATGREINAVTLYELFSRTYMSSHPDVRYLGHRSTSSSTVHQVQLDLAVDGRAVSLTGEGNGALDATVHALRALVPSLRVLSLEERSIAPSQQGADAMACAILELGCGAYGAGLDSDIVAASIRALLAALHRAGWRATAGLPTGSETELA